MSATVESPLVFLDKAPPDEAHLSKLWTLIADGQESLSNTENWVLKRVNDQAEGEVTWELVGRLAVFANRVRELNEQMLAEVAHIEDCLDDLSTLADGHEVDIAELDEYGRPQHDRETRWRDDVSHALGIEKWSGGWHPEDAKRIAAAMTETEVTS